MKKTFFFMFIFFILSLFMETNMFYLSLINDLIIFPLISIFSISWSFFLDFQSFYFLIMVSLVTSMVVLYSELYMEHYNNKKFFFLMISFLLSMIFLSVSGSFILLMLGWDGLGISSLLLIMFYPGKIPLYNSFMTFFYNRLGDCIMILTLCLLMEESNLFSCFLKGWEFNFILALLLFCSFTKSAQFPLSSWLPAAMSAPTPISAMVHSSTLVTAGIFIILKFYNFFKITGVLEFVFFFSALTFLAGGLLGFLELDLKKIVAFSTMSQISMIILFCSVGFILISVSHMFFHALFKTLLFCSCGLPFLWLFSDQTSKITPLIKTTSDYFFFMMFLSIFCMSGLPFSSSFFSKDLILEVGVSLNMSFLFSIMMLGSYLTILYSTKIFSMFSNFMSGSSMVLMKKKSFFGFSAFFCFLTFFSPYISELFLLAGVYPILGFQELLLILFILSFSLMSVLILPQFLCVMSMELFFSKYILFGNFGKIVLADQYSLNFNDHLLFKSNLFFSGFNKNLSKFLSINIFVMFLSSYFLWI